MAGDTPNWTRVSTKGLAPRQQLEIWREVSRSNYDVSFDRPDTDYALDYARFECGPLILAHYKRGPALSVRTPQLVRRSDNDAFHVQLALTGRSVGNADGASFNGTNHGFLVMDMGRPVEVCCHEDAEIAAFFIARDRMAELVPNPSDLHGVVAASPLAELFKDHLLSVMRRASSITPDTADSVTEAIASSDRQPPNKSQLG